MFTELEVKGQVYKLRLRVTDIVDLEKKLNHNPMDMFMELQKDKLPQLNEMLAVLHASMKQFNHGIKERDVYEIYEEYIEDGHSMFDLVPVMVELMQNSGIIPRDQEEEKEEE